MVNRILHANHGKLTARMSISHGQMCPSDHDQRVYIGLSAFQQINISRPGKMRMAAILSTRGSTMTVNVKNKIDSCEYMIYVLLRVYKKDM